MCAIFAFMFDVVLGAHGHINALTRDLDFKLLPVLQTVRQPAQLGHKLMDGVGFFNIAAA